MQEKLGLHAQFWSRLVVVALPLVVAFNVQIPLSAQEASGLATIRTLKTDDIRPGCSIEFVPSTSKTPPRNLDVEWSCDGGGTSIIDSYEEEGGIAEISSAFARKKRCIVVLVRWHIYSNASSFNGDIYRIFVYHYKGNDVSGDAFTRHELLGKNKVGWDGTHDGKKVTFPLKSKQKIEEKLDDEGIPECP